MRSDVLVHWISSFSAISSRAFLFSILLLYDFELTWYKHGFSLINYLNDASWSSDITMFSCHKWRHMISSQKNGSRLAFIFFSWVESDRALWTLLQPDSTQVEMLRKVPFEVVRILRPVNVLLRKSERSKPRIWTNWNSFRQIEANVEEKVRKQNLLRKLIVVRPWADWRRRNCTRLWTLWWTVLDATEP